MVIYVVEFENNRKERKLERIEAESIEELAKRLVDEFNALEVFEVLTEEEANKISDRQERVQELLINMRWRFLTDKDKIINLMNEILYIIQNNGFERFEKLGDRIYKVENDDYIIYIQQLSDLLSEKIMMTFYVKLIDSEEACVVAIAEWIGNQYIKQVIWHEDE